MYISIILSTVLNTLTHCGLTVPNNLLNPSYMFTCRQPLLTKSRLKFVNYKNGIIFLFFILLSSAFFSFQAQATADKTLTGTEYKELPTESPDKLSPSLENISNKEQSVVSNLELDLTNIPEFERKVVLEQLQKNLIGGIRKKLKDGSVKIYNEKTCCGISLRLVLSVGMGFNLISIYKGNGTIANWAAKLSGIAGSLPLAVTGLYAAGNAMADRGWCKCCGDKEISHAIKTTISNQECEEYDLENKAELIDPQMYTNDTLLTLILAAFIALVDSSFDTFLAGKGMFNLVSTESVIPKIIGSVIAGGWNLIPSWGCAFLGSIKIAKVITTPKKWRCFTKNKNSEQDDELGSETLTELTYE